MCTDGALHATRVCMLQCSKPACQGSGLKHYSGILTLAYGALQSAVAAAPPLGTIETAAVAVAAAIHPCHGAIVPVAVPAVPSDASAVADPNLLFLLLLDTLFGCQHGM